MKIYLYDKKTLEYKGFTEAEQDPEETKLQGKFVPLVPANATLVKPPQFKENEIPVLCGDCWIIYPDFRRKYYKIDENLNPKEITEIGISEDDIVVEKEIAQEILENPDKFKIVDRNLVRKSEEEIQNELIVKRKTLFEAEFFNTSLGWIRRKVTMQNGVVKDFLSDIVLSIKAGLEMNQEVKIITYRLPDFKEDLTEEYMLSLQDIKIATIDFVQECLLQTVKDFGLEGRQ